MVPVDAFGQTIGRIIDEPVRGVGGDQGSAVIRLVVADGEDFRALGNLRQPVERVVAVGEGSGPVGFAGQVADVVASIGDGTGFQVRFGDQKILAVIAEAARNPRIL